MSFSQVRTTSRIVQWTVGAILAGSAAVILSGSALADSSPGTTTQADQTDQTQVTTTTSTVSVDQGDNTTSGAVGVSVDTNHDNQGGTPTASADTTAPTTGATSPTNPLDSVGATTTSTDAVPPTTTTQTAPPTIPTAEAVATTVAHLARALPSITTVGASVLLAAALPAPVAQAPVKQPVKTNGLLVQLTDKLAATIVPFTIRLGQLPAVPVLVFAFGLMTIIATVIVGANFVASLRRSGYRHAARSDVISSFATSLPLGYGRGLFGRVGGPVFVMSEIKIPN